MHWETTPITGWVWFSLETKQLPEDRGVLRSNNLSANTCLRQTQQVLPLPSLSSFASTWGPFQGAGFSAALSKEVRQCALQAPPTSADKMGAQSRACAVIIRENLENKGKLFLLKGSVEKVKEGRKESHVSGVFVFHLPNIIYLFTASEQKRVSFIEDTNQLWLLPTARVFSLCILSVKYSASTRCF